MARWIRNPPAECSDPHERRFAELLKGLGKGWTIRWGFYYRDNAGVLREGDFLIFGPDCGLLVLEVKRDRFRAFRPTGRWEGDPTTNRDHPLYQLDQEHAAVIRALEENGPTRHGIRWSRPPVCRMIAFPKGRRPGMDCGGLHRSEGSVPDFSAGTRIADTLVGDGMALEEGQVFAWIRSSGAKNNLTLLTEPPFSS